MQNRNVMKIETFVSFVRIGDVRQQIDLPLMEQAQAFLPFAGNES